MTKRIVGRWRVGPNGMYRRRRSSSGRWYTETHGHNWHQEPEVPDGLDMSWFIPLCSVVLGFIIAFAKSYD